MNEERKRTVIMLTTPEIVLMAVLFTIAGVSAGYMLKKAEIYINHYHAREQVVDAIDYSGLGRKGK